MKPESAVDGARGEVERFLRVGEWRKEHGSVAVEGGFRVDLIAIGQFRICISVPRRSKSTKEFSRLPW